MATSKKMKPLSRMRNDAKGAIHHIEIHPAKNSAGGQGFITQIHRHPSPTAQKAMAKGSYMPSPPPDETVHEDGQDMLDHVGNAYGIKPEDDGDSDDDQGEGA